ncbi:multidrug resistance protein [Tasmannia lanceolata]|uniref:multidrug resistance protein n=1 Tax=Tasmannia lanceolata TaxID=3420 RepID=UPI0040635890
MGDFSPDRPKSWTVYNGANPIPSQPVADKEAPWMDLGTSVNSISFGFVATAILISMFLIMAIFEHLLRPRTSFPSSQNTNEDSLESGPMRGGMQLLEKHGGPRAVAASYSSDFSVVMPGQHYPTFIAQPAPLACSRERVYWPSHDHGYASP